MNPTQSNPSSPRSRRVPGLGRIPARWLTGAAPILLLTLWPNAAHASIFQGETLDMVADILTWIVLVVAPAVAVAVFWIVHILPEKIAEKKQHPQAKAIQCLCLLSLVFGGLLWPIAWLWAYTKPVLHKLAYGTDKVLHGHEDPTSGSAPGNAEEELQNLRRRLAELETKLGGSGLPKEEKLDPWKSYCWEFIPFSSG